jgi:hypothetical protein
MRRIQALRMSLWKTTRLPSGVYVRSKINRPFQSAAGVTPSLRLRLLNYKYERGTISRADWIEGSMGVKCP